MTARPRPLADVPPWAVELLAEVRAMRQDLARRFPLRREAASAGALLAAIWRAVGDRTTFTASELIDHASLTAAEGLREAILDSVGSLDARRLGKLLRRIAGEDLSGFRVVRLGADGAGARWECRALPVTAVIP